MHAFGSKGTSFSGQRYSATIDDKETQGDILLVSDIVFDTSLVLTKIQPRTELVVVGSAAVDISAQAIDSTAGGVSVGLHSTLPGAVSMTLGGVGRNIAEAAHRILTSHASHLSTATMLLSPIGDDAFGRVLLEEMRHMGMRTDGLLQKSGARSAVCNMVLDSAGNLTCGIADMDIIQLLDGQCQMVRDFTMVHSPGANVMSGSANPGALQPQYCSS
jgi:pseudouridine-5'-phosphate glycosidase/pseudouridine kinase